MEDEYLKRRIEDLLVKGQDIIDDMKEKPADQPYGSIFEIPSSAENRQSACDPSELTLDARVLHAVVGMPEISVNIGESLIIPTMRYGDVSQYYRIKNGFQVVTVTTLDAPREILFNQVIPYAAGTKVTIVIFNIVGGIDVKQFPELSCYVSTADAGCFRVCNLLQERPIINIVLNDNRTIFSKVRYKQITEYVQVEKGNYDLSVVQWSDNYSIKPSPNVPLLSFFLSVETEHQYTVYIVAADSDEEIIQVLIIKN